MAVLLVHVCVFGAPNSCQTKVISVYLFDEIEYSKDCASYLLNLKENDSAQKKNKFQMPGIDPELNIYDPRPCGLLSPHKTLILDTNKC